MQSRKRVKLHRLFHHRTLCAADGLHLLHTLLDRRLGEERSFLELLKNAGALVFLLETTDSAVDGFVFTDDNSDQRNHLLTIAMSRGLCLGRDTLDNFGFCRLRHVFYESSFAKLFKNHGDRLHPV